MSLHAAHMDPQHGTDTSIRVPRKRKRRTFACTICHRRKLKCDQTYPACKRCVSSASECVYMENNLSIPAINDDDSTRTQETATASTATEDGGTDNPNVLRDFTSPARSDTFLSKGQAREPGTSKSGSDTRESSVQFNTQHARQKCEVETFLLKGNEFATQYYGATHPMSVLLHIPSLQSFIVGGHLTAFATFPHLQKDFKILQDSIRNNNTRYVARPESAIINMLPGQAVARSYAELYFEQFEATYRILHEPTFWKEFDNRIDWHDTEKSGITFAVILLLVILIARTIAPANWAMHLNLDLDSIAPPPTIVDTCKAWLGSQTRKHLRIDLFQIRILIHVAELINCVQLKQTWASAGSLVSFAKGAGLHRDPSLLQGTISPYNQQMRRMLWATILELDLLASLDRGMSPAVCDQSWDSEAPRNLNDDAYSSTSRALPKAKEDSDFTSQTYLIFSQRSVRLRTELCSVLNSSTLFLSHDQVLEYEDQLKALLDNFPTWETDKGQAIRTMTEMQLRQYLLLVHFRFLQQSLCRPRRRYSTFVCLTEAMSILQGYNSLRKLGYHSHALLSMGSILRPSIALCYAVGTGSGPPDGHISPESVHKSLEAGLAAIQDNVLRNARGFKEYWHMSATYYYTMSQSAATEQRKIELGREAWERVAGLLYRVTAARKNGVVAGEALQSPALSPQTAVKRPRGVHPDIPDPSAQRTSLDAALFEPMDQPTHAPWFELPDIGQWEFDDTWNFDFSHPM